MAKKRKKKKEKKEQQQQPQHQQEIRCIECICSHNIDIDDGKLIATKIMKKLFTNG